MLLLGQTVAEEIQHQIRAAISLLSSPPGLAVVLIGDHPASQTYVQMKRRASATVGIHSFLHHLPETTTEVELLQLIDSLNERSDVDGILVQAPLPAHMNSALIIEAISPQKDVDGFHPINMGKLLIGEQEGFIPCTPLGIKTLLQYYKIRVEGKHVVIVGRSSIVGKPLAALLMQKRSGANATVTILHSKSEHFKDISLTADILVAAVGSPRFITQEMVKEGAVVIDVGINREEDSARPKGYRLVGDVDFEAVEPKCSAITPVPKGVGPMTVAMLLQNTLLSYKTRHQIP